LRGVETAYEIRVLIPNDYDVVENKAFSKFSSRLYGGKFKSLKQAESHAEKLAKKHNGHVTSVRKIDIERIYDTTCFEPLIEKSKVHPALVIDEFIWKKRNIRRGNLEKEKSKIAIDNKEIK
jgi:hypothetical protein